MNTNVDLTLSLAADGSALPSLFFRPADRLRLEGCVAALTQEGRSLRCRVSTTRPWTITAAC